jgi:hypothetical protein
MVEEDHCPFCHGSVFNIRGKHVRCVMCDFQGNIKIGGDKIEITYDEEELKK